MAVTIEESGMNFGPFSEDQIFYVEKSNIYNKLQNGLPVAEFMLIQSDKNLLLVVEAKSSSPNPSIECPKFLRAELGAFCFRLKNLSSGLQKNVCAKWYYYCKTTAKDIIEIVG